MNYETYLQNRTLIKRDELASTLKQYREQSWKALIPEINEQLLIAKSYKKTEMQYNAIVSVLMDIESFLSEFKKSGYQTHCVVTAGNKMIEDGTFLRELKLTIFL